MLVEEVWSSISVPVHLHCIQGVEAKCLCICYVMHKCKNTLDMCMV